MKPKDPRNAIDDDDKEFWIEEKLDGERMQLHMISDDSMPGGKRFAFWSRKAKDYTYLYGNGLRDEKSSLTRYLKDAFDEGVENIILDGESEFSSTFMSVILFPWGVISFYDWFLFSRTFRIFDQQKKIYEQIRKNLS